MAFDVQFALRSADCLEAERARYREECRVRCLESALDRVGPDGFLALMSELEDAQKELLRATAYRGEVHWKTADAEVIQLFGRKGGNC